VDNEAPPGLTATFPDGKGLALPNSRKDVTQLPPVPAVPSAAKVVANYNTNDVSWNTVMHVGKGVSTPWTIAECATAAESLYPLIADLMGQLSGQTLLESVEVQDLYADNSFSVYVPESPAGGGQAGTPVSVNTCICVSWGLGVKYRGGKPRTYLSGTVATVIANPQELTEAAASSTAALANTFISNVQTITVAESNLYLACVAYSRDKEPLANPLVLPVTSASVSRRLASQRRRLGKESSFPRET
jgi:hypothetical protein